MRMPTHQAIASHAASPIGVPIRSDRMASMIGVTGWCSAIHCSHEGIDSTGTKALERYGTNRMMNPYAARALGALRREPDRREQVRDREDVQRDDPDRAEPAPQARRRAESDEQRDADHHAGGEEVAQQTRHDMAGEHGAGAKRHRPEAVDDAGLHVAGDVDGGGCRAEARAEQDDARARRSRRSRRTDRWRRRTRT